MRQFGTIYKKEMIEMWRNYKWIWVPLVFILFGIMQPISTYFMPEILDKLGGFPEGTIIEIPKPTGGEMMVKTLSQFNTIGVLVLVLSFMGIISSEKESGVASMILIKPVKYHNYILAKWFGALSLTVVSLGLGYLSSWYYTDLLIDHIVGVHLLNSFLVYIVWLGITITIILFFSTMIKSNGGTAFLTILLLVGLSILPSIAPQFLKYSPGVLSSHAYAFLLTGSGNSGLVTTIALSFIVIIVLLIGTIYLFRSTFNSPA